MKEEKINPEIQNTGAVKSVSDEKWETPEMDIISMEETKAAIGAIIDGPGNS